MLKKPCLNFPKSATYVDFGLKTTTPTPPLELFQKFIRFGSGTLPLGGPMEVHFVKIFRVPPDLDLG